MAGLSEIINVSNVAKGLPDSKLTSAGLLAAFKNGKTHSNFLAHDMCVRWEAGSGAVRVV